MRKKYILRGLYVGLAMTVLLGGCGSSGKSDTKVDQKEVVTKTQEGVEAEENSSVNKEENEAMTEEKMGETSKEDAAAISETAESSTKVVESESGQSKDQEMTQEKLSGYVEQLRSFAESGEWKSKFEKENLDADPGECNELEYKIFDMDGNGIPEMLIYASAPQLGGSHLMSMSCFCIIENNEISFVLSGSTTDGSMGGTTISMVKRKDSGELQIAKSLKVGGFGGDMLKNHYYSYRDALLKEEKFISKTTYFNADNGTDEYIIDGSSVSVDEVDRQLAEYEWIKADDIPSYIETY